MARICPLFSGSSGNSYFIGSAEAGILIDVGRSAKQITEMLQRCDIPLSSIHGIFITHEHTDHVKGLRVFASKHHIPVFASRGTMAELERAGALNGNFPVEILEEQEVVCGGIAIRPFHTSHDSAESLGFQMRTSDDRTIAFATDLGVVSEEVRENLCGSDFVVLESNHDVGMLQNGGYPYPLKKRILSDRGHLSNLVCSGMLPALASSGTTRFLLAHLSEENNTPDIACQTALCALSLAGMKANLDFQLAVAPKENIKGKTILF